MGRKSSSMLLLTVLLIFSVSLTNLNPVYAKESKLAQAVYITTTKACGCILERCQAGDWVVEKTFVGEKQALLKRVDYALDKERAKTYIRKYRLPMPPALLFLDQHGNLLWRFDGEIDMGLLEKKLKEFGA
jgi:hypothetical protein